ncbi:MAG: phosphatase 2C-like domain-containing protein [Monoraphidium minutum]|nr:MAG: phosphatase 2C-like domain-containing protein [Monoraphidium minutum]
MVPIPEGLDIGSFTAAGNRYGTLNQDYVQTEVWWDGGAGAGGVPGRDAVLIGAVLDGHGLLGESAARLGGAAVVREVRRLVADAMGAGAAGSGAAGAGPELHSAGTDPPVAAPEGPAAAAAAAPAAATPAAPPPPLRPLASMPEPELRSLFDAAFAKAHATALAIYDSPPSTACYPHARTGAPEVYCLQTRGGLHLYGAPPGSRGGAPLRPLEFGATCTVALLQGRRLVVGNVGDSSAVLGSLDDEGGVTARLLTFQHCGLQPTEAARISEGYGGSVQIMPQDGYMAVSGGMWAGYQLSVTRALGHKHMESFGVLHQPSVMCVDLRPEDCCVVLASDGVWDVMDPREVVNRAMDALSGGAGARAAARQLVEDAVSLAQGAPSGDADNTSAVVIALPLGG